MRLSILIVLMFLVNCSGFVIEQVSPNKTLRTPSKVVKKVDTAKIISNQKKEKVYIIDDFEDGDLYNNIGAEWYKWNDQDNGGGSSYKILKTKKDELAGVGFNSKHCLTIDYQLQKKEWRYKPYIGLGVFVIKGSKPFDGSGYLGLRYSYKGAGHTVHIETADITDYDTHGKVMKPSKEWTTVEIPWNELKQEGWGKYVKFDNKKIKKFSINIAGADGEKGKLLIDNIEFYTEAKIIKDVKNDMEALPIENKKIETGDITINNPLQSKAMKYLNKGVNISNWLEADEYNYSMEYDESDVKLMSEIGFKSLRVPINLDFFLKNRSSYFTSQEEPKFKSDLFMIIDKFSKWTKKYNMGLTIDHHQYKRSLNGKTQTDRNYSAQFGKMEKQVVKYLASLGRKDIFFEIYNEPDDKILAKDWAVVAQEAIDSIRTVDTTVTLIVGSEYWYNIDHLVKMKPFNDNNTIYAFHFYEPFVFTHQGATWVEGAGSIMNVPYPYKQSEWKTNSEYYGVYDDTPEWLKNEVLNYYKISGKNAIKAKILVAKKWAVKNNVALICNEFGALRRGTTPKSRANYLKMMRENLEELEIPWQHWEWKRGLGIVEEINNKEWKLQNGMEEVFGF